MAMRDEIQPLFKQTLQCESCHRDKEETIIVAKLEKTRCNDDMFVLCHHGVIHSAQLEGKMAV